jgi:hypothetical protein
MLMARLLRLILKCCGAFERQEEFLLSLLNWPWRCTQPLASNRHDIISYLRGQSSLEKVLSIVRGTLFWLLGRWSRICQKTWSWRSGYILCDLVLIYHKLLIISKNDNLPQVAYQIWNGTVGCNKFEPLSTFAKGFNPFWTCCSCCF